uniref:Uncharacterized protein n=1 Tax=Grammatophora oceanica TaxID=210454 RepID=A0A7S1VHU0_9STRA|mmetsp:Transcript_46956/g.69836  ORF Transcript_46956/g.69836 Transcript_46956/m.69836 type:complete len:344 (+) Transcript_46956:198-1229(+)|eukprot:CAMPEP_0194053752 /NCGR_PEP_ID=MMETSP0009_2-20130614/51141_1 /TAXON_ID=210454 /ORGANISM="Grammatophora oceanica, Strain CCMP 410" /LENGTH=343 /DNA_ID=CAMNT_0038702003 /DNA_START=106 /DNA_END=1137 /DNA_ORIENTATION=-
MASSSTYFEQKRRYLLNLYPDLEDFEQGVEKHDDHEGDLEASSITAKSDGTADSSGSTSTTGQQEEEDLRNSQRPRRPFWVPNTTTSTTKSKMSSKTKRKKDELPSASSDASPRGLRPDGCCDEDEEKRTFRFYKIVAISLVLLVGMLIAIVLLSLRLVARKESSGDDASAEPDQIRVYEPSNNIFEATSCDISNVESICSRPDDGSHREELDLSEIPKCVQDNFNLVYVRAGHDAYYQLHSIDDLKSCSNEGMALKRLAAMEHEESTTGMLSCQYTAYTWYYKFGQVEWWTADGAAQTSICDDQADVVVCTTTANDSTSMSRTVETFIIETGEECILSELSL